MFKGRQSFTEAHCFSKKSEAINSSQENIGLHSVPGRNMCMSSSSHALCYRRMRFCANRNSFVSYNEDVICACPVNMADCQ